jgi:hypothetical protein
MKNSYFDLIDQTFDFSQEGFDLKDGYLYFHGVSIKRLKHCLVPSPKHIVIDRDANGNHVASVLRDKQKAEDMLKILGY